MKVYLFKYALSSGVEVVSEHHWALQFGNWAKTRPEALALVESMRTKKLASLRKQIAKLDAMDVEKMVPKPESEQ